MKSGRACAQQVTLISVIGSTYCSNYRIIYTATEKKLEDQGLQNLFLMSSHSLSGPDDLVLFCFYIVWREGIAARVGKGGNDHTQGSLWSGSRRTILRAPLRSLGWALPAVSICQPRSAKRCVSVEEGGWRAGEDYESDVRGDEYIIYPSLCQIKARSTVEDGPRVL